MEAFWTLLENCFQKSELEHSVLVLREKLEKLESDSSIVCWFRKKLNLCTFPDQQDQGGVTIILIVALHIILDQQSIS